MCVFFVQCSYQVKSDVWLYSQGQLTWIKKHLNQNFERNKKSTASFNILLCKIKNHLHFEVSSICRVVRIECVQSFCQVLPRIFLFAPSLITRYCFIAPFVMVCYLPLLLLLHLIVLPVLLLKVISWPLPVFVLSSYLIIFVILNFPSFHGLVTCHNAPHLCLIVFLAFWE